MVADTSDYCSLEVAKRIWVSDDNEGLSWSETARQVQKYADESEVFTKKMLAQRLRW